MIFKHIWYLITSKSDSDMEGMRMGWEWNWPTFQSSQYSISWFNFSFSTHINGDHSPGLYCNLTIANLNLLDFVYHNAYHEKYNEDDELQQEISEGIRLAFNDHQLNVE